MVRIATQTATNAYATPASTSSSQKSIVNGRLQTKVEGGRLQLTAAAGEPKKNAQYQAAPVVSFMAQTFDILVDMNKKRVAAFDEVLSDLSDIETDDDEMEVSDSESDEEVDYDSDGSSKKSSCFSYQPPVRPELKSFNYLIRNNHSQL